MNRRAVRHLYENIKAQTPSKVFFFGVSLLGSKEIIADSWGVIPPSFG